MENIVIGIEGLVGAGKTPICKELLNYIPNSILLNGGNLYRAIVYVLLTSGKSITDLSNMKNVDIKNIMNILDIEIKIEDRETTFYVKGIKIEEEEMQSKDASLGVSELGGIADNSKLFEFAKDFINNLKSKYNIIIAGRDIIHIYPEITYHFFITASLDVRVNRKFERYEGTMSKEELKEHIIKRDELQKKAGFYNISNKTITLDVSDCNTVEKSTKKVLKQIFA